MGKNPEARKRHRRRRRYRKAIERTCARKRRCNNQWYAASYLLKVAERIGQDPRWLEVYQCPFCLGWHVGHRFQTPEGIPPELWKWLRTVD